MNEATTIRGLVIKIEQEVRGGNLTPIRVAELIAMLSSLIGNCNEAIRKREMDYKRFLRACYDRETKANRAKIVAETSQEYEELQEAKDTKESVIEMMSSLKYLQRAVSDEMKFSGNQ